MSPSRVPDVRGWPLSSIEIASRLARWERAGVQTVLFQDTRFGLESSSVARTASAAGAVRLIAGLSDATLARHPKPRLGRLLAHLVEGMRWLRSACGPLRGAGWVGVKQG